MCCASKYESWSPSSDVYARAAQRVRRDARNSNMQLKEIINSEVTICKAQACAPEFGSCLLRKRFTCIVTQYLRIFSA